MRCCCNLDHNPLDRKEVKRFREQFREQFGIECTRCYCGTCTEANCEGCEGCELGAGFCTERMCETVDNTEHPTPSNTTTALDKQTKEEDITCCCNADGKEVKYGEPYEVECNGCVCGEGCTDMECHSKDDTEPPLPANTTTAPDDPWYLDPLGDYR